MAFTCSRCSASLPDNVRFCRRCGGALHPESDPAAEMRSRRVRREARRLHQVREQLLKSRRQSIVLMRFTIVAAVAILFLTVAGSFSSPQGRGWYNLTWALALAAGLSFLGMIRAIMSAGRCRHFLDEHRRHRV